jgi:hypothetical protein
MKLSPSDKELLGRTGEILHYMWDPIGVAGVPQARDEYEGYVPKVYQLLKATTDGRDVAAYLGQLRAMQMGVRADPVHDFRTVEALLEWRDHLAESSRRTSAPGR